MGPGEFPRALVLGPLGRERQWRFSLLVGAGAQLGWRSEPVNSLLTRGQKPGGQCPHGPHTKDLLEEDKGAAVLSMNPGAWGGDGTSDPLEGEILFPDASCRPGGGDLRSIPGGAPSKPHPNAVPFPDTRPATPSEH